MDSWKSFHETLLPDKEDFCKNLNMENVTNADQKNFDIKIFCEYHDLYVQSDTLSLADVFESF